MIWDVHFGRHYRWALGHIEYLATSSSTACVSFRPLGQWCVWCVVRIMYSC
jgi:hypothetical protein